MKFLCWLGWGICLPIIDCLFWISHRSFDVAIFLIKIEWWFRSRVEATK